MALKKSVFTPDLEVFIDQLVTLHHCQFFINAQLERSRKSVEKDLEHFDKKNWKQKAFFFGTGLPIVDIFHEGEFVVRAPTRARITQGNDVIQMAHEMERRFNAFLLVSLHEVLEDFLRAVYGKLLYQLRGEVAVAKKSFHKARPDLQLKEGTLTYFKCYADWVSRRDCKRILEAFEKHLDWKKVFITRLWGMSFSETIAAIGFCRHRIIHSQGRVSESDWRKLSKSQADFVKSCLHETLHTKEQLILPDSKLVDTCYEDIASYGRGLYVLASKRCGMSDDSGYFKKSRE